MPSFLLLASSVLCLTARASEPAEGSTRGIIDLKSNKRPAGAVQLVGSKGYELVPEKGTKSNWIFEDGVLTAPKAWDSLVTKTAYRDFRMHLEFNVNEVQGVDAEKNGNSGVYIQQRYEVQILNSHGVAPDDYKASYCASLYRLKKPDRLACKKPGEWQSYEIVFRAARFDGDKKIENARITVYHNEQLVHDDFAIPRKTGAGQKEGPEPKPIKLQGHNNPVRFRNVWIQGLELPLRPLKPGQDVAEDDASKPQCEVIEDYRKYIAGSGKAVVWYGRRTALVLDEDSSPDDREPETMGRILRALDAIFDAYERVTGRKPRLSAPLKGRARIEVAKTVGGGLAHHGKLGVGIGDGLFEGLYKRFDDGVKTVDQVFFYEIARNYWMRDMNPAIDYHTSKGPQDYGWWTVGFSNAMSIFLPPEIEQIDDMYYFGSGGKKFSEGMEENLKIYLASPEKYDWENSWNVPLVPWKERTSVNDLMTGLLIRLHREHGGIEFIRRLYEEIPKRKRLASRADRQGARDNFYEACSLAARKDLHDFFSKSLRWRISKARRETVRAGLAGAKRRDTDRRSQEPKAAAPRDR
jgi:hypothetical protein